MKKFFLIVAALLILLALAACASVEQHDEAPHDVVRMPSWVKDMGLDEDAEVIVQVSADYPYYTSIDSLSARASDIVRVEVLDERVELINTLIPSADELEDVGDTREAYDVFTVHRIRVLEVFKGNAEIGDILELKQIGGQWENITLICDDKIPFAIGNDLVLFLETYDIEGMPASLLNPFQSAYRFPPSGERIVAMNANEILESLYPGNRLTLTLEDLINLRNAR